MLSEAAGLVPASSLGGRVRGALGGVVASSETLGVCADFLLLERSSVCCCVLRGRLGLFPRFQTSTVQVKPGEERKQAHHSARIAAPLPAPGTRAVVERELLSGFRGAEGKILQSLPRWHSRLAVSEWK